MPDYTISPILAEQLIDCAGLFAGYPYKMAQQKQQRLDRQRLNAFYFENLKKTARSGMPQWLARSMDGRAIALAGLAEDAWHSSIYGMRMAKIQPWLNTSEPGAGEPLLGALLSAARERGIRHLSVRIDGEDFANLHLFERAGFSLVDVSLKFSRPMPLSALPRPETASGLQIALADPIDSHWIRELGSTTHGGTHYFNDPHLSRECTQELFAGWLERCLAGLAYHVYTLKAAGGEGVGFVNFLRAQSFAQAVGRTPLILDFVLIAPSVRGGGIGPWFIAETLACESGEHFDYCELRTSTHNLQAVMNYEKLDFRCCASDFVLHLKIESSS